MTTHVERSLLPPRPCSRRRSFLGNQRTGSSPPLSLNNRNVKMNLPCDLIETGWRWQDRASKMLKNRERRANGATDHSRKVKDIRGKNEKGKEF